MKSVLLISFYLSFLALFVPPTQAHGETSLAAGNVLLYDVSCVFSQDWTIEGRWNYSSSPGVLHYTNFTESRQRTIDGTVTVEVTAVRLYDVDLRISYDLHYYQRFWDRTLGDSNLGSDYFGSVNQTLQPNGPNIVEVYTYTSYWNYSDSMEAEISKLTRDFNSFTGYSVIMPLSAALNTQVVNGDDYCSFWIYPDAQAGENYAFCHAGVLLELIGDYQHYSASGNPSYEIEGSRTYYPPGGGKGFMQSVWVADYDASIYELTTFSASHSYTVDFPKYVNEFLFDQDTGILLQYHRTYRVLPFFIRYSSSPNSPLDATNDIYNLEFTMTLRDSSNVWLGLSLLDTILLCVLIPVGLIAVIYIYYRRRRRQ